MRACACTEYTAICAYNIIYIYIIIYTASFEYNYIYRLLLSGDSNLIWVFINKTVRELH